MDQNTFLSEVTDRLAARVESGVLRGWSLKSTVSSSHQRLYASPDGQALSCHQSRRVNGTAYKLSVYSVAEDDGVVGTAMIDLAPHRPVDEQLDAAIELSRCSHNLVWELAAPPAEKPEPVDTCDPEVRDRPEAVMELIENQFAQAFSATKGCRLNSAELYVNYHLNSVLNSNGLAYEDERSDIYLEAAMERAGSENDKEVHEHATAVSAAGLDVNAFVEQCAMQVAMLGDSREPENAESASILIDKEALVQMLEAVVEQLDCAYEYHKRPFLKAGDTLGGGSGDPLVLKLDPALPAMALSAAYTPEGLTARSASLIEDNTVVERVVGNRFGQYLELEPNGICGNIVVSPGSLTKEMLAGTEYTEIIKFSSLLIDSSKLTWSSEIKLGRHVAADGTITLVKGGVVSGNLRENFTDCRLSSELETYSAPPCSYTPARGYHGPNAMFITRGVSIAGQTSGENA